MPKIIIADNMKNEVIEKLKQAGEVLTPQNEGELKSALADADVLIVRSATKVTRDLIQNANSLKLVLRAGVGIDNIDQQACKEKSIIVKNTPGASTNAVAELTISMLIGISRKLGYLHSQMQKGEWAKKQGMGTEISGKTLAIVGLGRIGLAVAQKASALGMKIIYTDREKKNVPYQFHQSLDSLLPEADYISLHAGIDKGAPPMFQNEQFQKCKKGAYIINLARGKLIDEKALIGALNSGQIAGAALDVYESEPYSGGLSGLSNVLLTPHVGASTSEAQLKIADELLEHIKAI